MSNWNQPPNTNQWNKPSNTNQWNQPPNTHNIWNQPPNTTNIWNQPPQKDSGSIIVGQYDKQPTFNDNFSSQNNTQWNVPQNTFPKIDVKIPDMNFPNINMHIPEMNPHMNHHHDIHHDIHKHHDSHHSHHSHSKEQFNVPLSNDKSVHTGVVCDQCRMNPVKGKRFKCLNCKDFDYCERCYYANKKSHLHPFNQITKERENVFDNTKCDGCSLAPIVGIRHKCNICQNFDYCDRCFKANDGIHTHPFTSLTY